MDTLSERAAYLDRALRSDRDWLRAVRYYDENLLDAAGAKCARLLARYPDSPQINAMLASIALAGRRHREATAFALSAAPGVTRLELARAVTLVWTLVLVGEAQAAERALEAIAAGRNWPSIGLEFARQAITLQLYPLAERFLSGWRASGAQSPMGPILAGNLRKYAGDFAGSAACYREAIAMDPRSVLAWWSITQVCGVEGAEDRIQGLLRLLDLPGLNPDGQSHLHYALFAEYDRLDQTESAWKHLRAGCELRQRFIRYDAAAEADSFAVLQRVFDAPFMAQQSGSSEYAPIFIVGMPRTGTTLLEQLMARHPSIQACGELPDVGHQYSWACDYTVPGLIDRRAAELAATVDYDTLGHRIEAATRHYLQGPAEHVLIKTPDNFVHVGAILKAMPRARIIHMRRNPMDSCFSNLKEIFSAQAFPYSYRFQDLATHFRQYRGLMAHWQALAPDRMLGVDYEDLVRAPETEVARVLSFCGLDMPEQAQSRAAAPSMVSTASSVQVRQPIHQRGVEAWRRYAGPLEPLQRLLGEH